MFFGFGALPGRGASVSAALMRFFASGSPGASGFGRAGRRRLFLTTMLLPLLAGAARPCAGQGVAQQTPAPADTARRQVQLPEARVRSASEAALLQLKLATSPAGTFTTRLDPAALGPGASLGAVLANQTPLAVRQYGPGQLASLSVRGTSAQQVAVLWHGFNLNFPTLGQADLSLLPAAALTSAELLHGPDAARYGSGAVGGALRVATDDFTADLYSGHELTPAVARGQVVVAAGSFGQQAVSMRADVGGAHQRSSTSAQMGRAANDFPYRYRTFQGTQTARQVNAATRSYSVTQDYSANLGTAWRLAAAAWLTGAERQIAPALNTPNTHAQEHDASRRLLLAATYREHTTLRVASFADVIDYTDDRTGPSDSRSQSWQGQLETAHQLRYHGPNQLRVRGGLEAQHFRARADGYGAGVKTEHRAAAFGEATLERSTSHPFTATLSVRQAVLPQGRAPFTPALRADWQALERANLHLWASAARAYRAPTLNERYWRPGGNPDLRPEDSFGYEAGATLSPSRQYGQYGALGSLEIVAFQQRVSNWVQWTPDGATGLWSPRNLRRVRSRGIEAQAKILLRGAPATGSHTALRLAGQWLQTVKTAGLPADPDPVGVQLPYVPTRAGSATLLHGRNLLPKLRLDANFSGTLTSRRTTTADGQETLPGYGLLHAGASLTRPFGSADEAGSLTLRLDCFNLLNSEYQSQQNRPMPGRAWQVSLTLRTP